MDIEEVKKRYSEFEKKYNLPGFNDVNLDFEIDKVEKDSYNFVRVVRKLMMEKIVNSMGFVEMLLNPSNAPRIYFSYIKSMSVSDKEEIEKIYSALADLSLASLTLEIDSLEKKEAELIKTIYESWNKVKSSFRKVIVNMQKPKDNVAKKEKTYFG